MKRFFTIFMSVLTLSIPATGKLHTDVPVRLASDEPDIHPYANQTGYIYRTINGKRYKRLWFYTYNRWEEPYWHLA